MKNLKYIFVFALLISFLSSSAQEKKIKFNKGTLKICSSKKFDIIGYDGNEVIIKSIHDKRGFNYSSVVKIKGKGFPVEYGFSKTDSVLVINIDDKRKNGLKKLGKKNENLDLGIYFIIEQKATELIFKDNIDGELVMMNNEKYEIKIPNSIKLNWEPNGCKDEGEKMNQYVFYTYNASSLSNFDGEVEISTSLNNMKLVDVTGPVSINSIGGNVTIEFIKKLPRKLYSVYSNNGFIDVTLPSNSDVIIDANSSSIFSDIDFNVLKDKELYEMHNMLLKLKSGKVKMKLNAGLGNIYLRKK